ncbi:MAG: guanylate kinase [Clostridiales bacterium]|nr:guanylate kinase [Clostridiales bacterium]
MDKGILVVISGPSGAGKGSIYQQVIERTGMKRSVSVTTRAPRPGEVEGVNYFFRTEEEYQHMIAAGEFLETAAVYNNYYGTPKAPVFENLNNGYDVLFEVDVHGAKSIKKKYPEAIAIFVMTPDFETLEARLRGRGTETEDSLKTRLGAAKRELAQYDLFDYIVFNDNLDQAIADVLDIINAEKSKVKNNTTAIKKLLDSRK